MQQFNLKEYEKDPTNWALFIARGNPVRLLVTDVKGKYPILCLVTHDNGHEYPILVDEFGQEEGGEDELTVVMSFSDTQHDQSVKKIRPFTKDEFYREGLKHGHYIKNVKTGILFHPIEIAEEGLFIGTEVISYYDVMWDYVWADTEDLCGYKI